ncbi:UNVERIFIED_CONTAM: hypothetical protein RMT77_000640 [Armadillidium vulgare]
MWKAALLVTFGCLLIDEATSQGGAESLSFHGHLPQEYVKAKPPEGDNGPNDIYSHLPVRSPKLTDGDIVIYPHHYGFEFGQDSEKKIYEIHNAAELAAANSKMKRHHHLKHLKLTNQKLEAQGTSNIEVVSDFSNDIQQSSFQSNSHPSYPSPNKNMINSFNQPVHTHFG